MHPHNPLHTPALQYGSVCSGIEAVSLAWQPLGLSAAWFAEIEPFPRAVLAHQFPKVPNLGDMTRIASQIRAGRVSAPDILVGGTPCQSFSIAGERRGLDDPRGALTLAYVELANAIDQTRRKSGLPPVTLVWENVPGVLSDRSNAFGHFLAALAGERSALEPPGAKWAHAGHVSGPRRRIAWRVLDAQHFGLAQRRRRVFLVASGRDDLDPAEVLFERDRLRGDSSASDAPWQSTVAGPELGPATPGRYCNLTPVHGTVTHSVGFSNGRGPVQVSACLLAATAKHDASTETFMVQSVVGQVSHTLGAANGGKGCSEDGTGRGVPIIAFTAQDYGADAATELAPTVRTNVMPAIAFAQNTRGELRWESGHGHIAGPLSTGGGKPGQGLPAVLSVALRGRDHGMTAELGTDISTALRAASGSGAKGLVLAPDYPAHYLYTHDEANSTNWAEWRVRRLMPIECERLQGLPDNWTLVPYRGKPAADAPRYKAIGNSMAVPCLNWLGERLLQHLP